ncbi:hypothetical protein M9H77_02449 [Catharanthus roseus]|uniref:Uncharacterized protein n=1 Tax=Catharanthus roseus TaxID=4058 RepID=A0ACC0C8R1_CATRO|nr:hypothetical protein M9H77_02449 [Catharanthus roseus]
MGVANPRPTVDGRSLPVADDRVHLGYMSGIFKKKKSKKCFSRLSDTAWELLADRASLNMIIEKCFGAEVIGHFRLENLFRGLGWVPVIRFSGDYYPNLVREFYANILHKMDKDLPTIISHCKRENNDYQPGRNKIRASSSQQVEDDNEAKASDYEEDEAGAQNTISVDAFQTQMQTAFNKLRINQEI